MSRPEPAPVAGREAETGSAAPPRLDTAALVERLDEPAGWEPAAAALVADLGFRLLEGGRGPDHGHLVVAMRDRPTLRHFDPEFITFYGPDDGGATVLTVTRLQPGAALVRVALWGHVHVIDRIPVENRFLTFGGQLRLAGLQDGLTVAHLASPAPIVRWGGHSQGTDSLAGAIGAFFGRLIVPVDFTPGAAERIDAVSPAVLFTAFLRDEIERRRTAAFRTADPSDLDQWLAAAWARWRSDTATVALADDLLVACGLGPAV